MIERHFVTIVAPCYNESECIHDFYEALRLWYPHQVSLAEQGITFRHEMRNLSQS